MSENLSWLNGQLRETPQIATNNRGLLVGLGVFETIKVSEGVPHFLDRHLRRLHAGCQLLGLPGVDLDEIQQAATAVINANPQDHELARLRITITGQGDGGGIDTLISMTSMNPWPATTSCKVVPWIRNERSAIAGVKSTSYAENLIAQRWAQERGFSEGVFVNSLGELSEGTTSNIFLVKGDQVLTPHINCGVLPGIVREVLLENDLARESILLIEDLVGADEVFITSSTRGVHPVAHLGERKFDVVGQVTQEVQKAFSLIKTDS